MTRTESIATAAAAAASDAASSMSSSRSCMSEKDDHISVTLALSRSHRFSLKSPPHRSHHHRDDGSLEKRSFVLSLTLSHSR